ncbi:TonB-dependent receptor plug domain-containing protein [Flammeovirga agarivorans]|uniref:TonB-dependent receptor plug domain-containing protein n=1 Tax=Flammeovirga agarivorans TaxID=2726742 RepID=A0A7X8XY10_9BACT|nr:TonB-dependent receptor [Flammeovirga agarivorans]NLR93663.1 TonB-dependent receptor plug domain-containing protein [Flammeovirga agarivorans]
MKSKLFLCGLFLFFTSSTFSQTFDTARVLNEVEVIGQRVTERISFKSTTINKERIQENLSASLGELLTLNTPIFIKSYGAGGTATPSFRGTGASHTKVYWNGINLNSPMLGQVDLSLFPVAFTDEVTVNYGGSSLLYGTGGLGGGIQMNSNLNWDGKTHVLLSQTANTLQNYISNASVTLGNERIQSTTKVFYKDAGNYFTFVNPLQPGNPTWENNHSAQIQYGVLQEVGWRIDDYQQIKLDFWYQESDRELTPSMDSQEGDSWQSDASTRVLLNWNYNKNDLTIDASTAFVQESLWYRKELNNDENPKLSTSDSKTYQWHNHLRSDYQLYENFTIKGGVDLVMDQVNSNAYQSTQDTTSHLVHQNTLDVYAGFDWWVLPHLSISTLCRQEWIDFNQKPFLPSIGVEYNPYENDFWQLSVRGNSSKNFNAPSLNDRYWYPVGNPDLLPEEGWTHEGTLEIKYQDENWLFKYECTAFNSLINNWIIWKPAVSNLWRPENLKKVHSRGVEQIITTSYSKDDFSILLYGSLSFVKSESIEAYDELDNSVGKQLIYTPVGSFQGYIRCNYKSIYTIIEQQMYGKRYTQSDGSEYLPPYYLTNLVLGKQWNLGSHTIDLKGRIENVFGYYYQSIARKPMPTQVYQISLTYKI